MTRVSVERHRCRPSEDADRPHSSRRTPCVPSAPSCGDLRAAVLRVCQPWQPRQQQTAADLIVRNAKVTTLDDATPEAQRLRRARRRSSSPSGERRGDGALRGEQHPRHRRGRPARHSGAQRLAPARRPRRAVLQPRTALGRRRVAGTRAAMVREQAKRTPKGQWVRVIGGWSPYQFKRTADADGRGAERGGAGHARRSCCSSTARA